MSIGGKSQRTQARELHGLGWSLDEVADALRIDRVAASEFIYGKATSPIPRSGGISPASPAQRAKVKNAKCLVCQARGCDPAHLIPRSLAAVGADEPEAVVPLCRAHHEEYDGGELSLLEYLEPYHRAELAFAVERVGLLAALTRITGCRWQPAETNTEEDT